MAQRRGMRYDAAKEARALRFATALADALHDLHITHKELAQQLSVSIYAVDYWTRGADSSIPGAANLDKLCALLEGRRPGLGMALAKAAGHEWSPVASAPPPAIPLPVLRAELAGATPANLPHQISSFIGRERELREVCELIPAVRLLTLTGAGGIGKTRLAIQVAAAVSSLFPDGVWLVELAPLTESAAVPKAVAYALGLREEREPSATDKLVTHLGHKRVLLVLDNCEHLLDECARLVLRLLQACPGLTVLATSREALHLEGETLWRVPPLALPAPQPATAPSGLLEYAAVRLFVERATGSSSAFALTTENAAAVAQICTQLDGVPLAIELAAACVSFLTVAQIAARLDDQFRLLSTRSRTVLPRHKTLHAAIEWSYNLLADAEQALFRRLSVFADGWSLEGAEATCAGGAVETAAIASLLRALVDKSLVLAEVKGHEARYSMLQTLREYALLRLQGSERAQEGPAERDALGARYAEYYAALAERAEPQILGQQQAAWFARLEAEYGNIQAALRVCEDRGYIETGLRLAGALLHFWLMRGYLSESQERLKALLAATPSPPSSAREKLIWGRAWNTLGGIAQTQGDYAGAGVYFAQGLALRREVGDPRLIARSLSNLGNVAWLQGDYRLAQELYTESLALWRELGDKSGMSIGLNNLGLLAWYDGDPGAARALHSEALAFYQEIGDRWGASTSLNDLGNLAWFADGDRWAARTLYEQSLAIRRELSNKSGIAMSLSDLARLACAEGHYSAAHALWEESLRLSWEIGEKRLLIACLMGFAWLQGAQAGPEQAAQLLGAASALIDATGFKLRPVDVAEYERTASTARRAMGEAQYSRAWRRGYALSSEQAMSVALSEEAGGRRRG